VLGAPVKRTRQAGIKKKVLKRSLGGSIIVLDFLGVLGGLGGSNIVFVFPLRSFAAFAFMLFKRSS